VAGAVTQQTVSIGVRGAGISVSPARVELTLLPTGDGTARAELPRLTVIDARGTLAGWTVSVTPSFAGNRALQLRPSTPTPIDGLADGLRAGPATRSGSGVARPLAVAAAGEGGGAFAVGGSITLRADAPVTVVVDLAVQ
jgi:hypothetical protein